MATYAIGDIQGCYQTLQKLLNNINFDPASDTLWLAGDLINRGKHSLETLAFVYQYRQNIRCVLGNHDLHFLAVESGQHKATKKDTFDEILNAPECSKYALWLTQQPLFYFEPNLNFAMSHAGIPPCWSIQQAIDLSDEVSQCLQSSQRIEFFSQMYGNQPEQWHDELSGIARLRYITNALTRMRYCFADGSLELTCKAPPSEKPYELTPWFDFNNEKVTSNVIFGHWASLQGSCSKENLFALDTGCVWGGKLTALRLEDKQIFSCQSVEP